MTDRDPLGKRALFEGPAVAADPLAAGEPLDGRVALFSAGPHRPGTVLFHCSVCGVRTRMSVIEAAFRVLMISLWAPGRRYSRWVQCPECQRRTWSRIEWLG